jgi:hypothetical protein
MPMQEMPLEECHWKNTIGRIPLEEYHWRNDIGRMTIVEMALEEMPFNFKQILFVFI